ncbi:uncharacterized protein LOC119724803 isoform X2 [Patiria miniata]|uniref:Uncharacterized protein n=1 Tax=Patiria miniata TaxID=46514 RepID=A0A913ZLH5_PATMI|nr:uncharacterized protein LOC119724803 isoform X2 [Patiria miniata]
MTLPAYTPLSNDQPQMVQQQNQQQQQHQVAVQPGNVQVVSGNQTHPGNWTSMTGTGITQIVLGSLTVILGIVACVIGSFYFFIGHAFWCGIGFYCVAGILGVVAGQKQNQCAAIAYMILSIFACLASCIVMGISGTAAALDRYSFGFYTDNWEGKVAVDAMLAIVALVEFVVSIVGASMTCGAICNTPPAHTVIHYQAQPQFVVAAQPQGVTYYAPQGQQQFASYPAQQVVAPQGPYFQGQAVPQAPPQAMPQAMPHAAPQYQPLTK